MKLAPACCILVTATTCFAQACCAQGGEDVDLRCGAYCLYVSLKALDIPVASFEELEAELGQPTRLGYSLQQLEDAAERFGAHTLSVSTSIENLSDRDGPFACIALINKSRYVCIYDLGESSVYLADPPRLTRASRDAFRDLWEGEALLISDRPLSLMARRTDRWPKYLVPIAVPLAIGCMLFLWVIRVRGRGNR